MDINPYEFKDSYAYEWAYYLKKEEPDVVIFL